jgi:hypothetical protein
MASKRSPATIRRGRGVLLAGAAVAIALAACAGQLPSEKSALESFAAEHRDNAPTNAKQDDPGRPAAGPADEPPDTGLLGKVNAPVSGGVFTPSNAWAGWTDPTTYTQVFAGIDPDSGKGMVFVVRRPGADGVLTPDAEPMTTFISPPGVGGALQIVRVDGDELVVVNPAGTEFHFRPADARFD